MRESGDPPPRRLGSPQQVVRAVRGIDVLVGYGIGTLISWGTRLVVCCWPREGDAFRDFPELLRAGEMLNWMIVPGVLVVAATVLTLRRGRKGWAIGMATYLGVAMLFASTCALMRAA